MSDKMVVGSQMAFWSSLHTYNFNSIKLAQIMLLLSNHYDTNIPMLSIMWANIPVHCSLKVVFICMSHYLLAHETMVCDVSY